jgi:hypothetical protein
MSSTSKVKKNQKRVTGIRRLESNHKKIIEKQNHIEKFPGKRMFRISKENSITKKRKNIPVCLNSVHLIRYIFSNLRYLVYVEEKKSKNIETQGCYKKSS